MSQGHLTRFRTADPCLIVCFAPVIIQFTVQFNLSICFSPRNVLAHVVAGRKSTHESRYFFGVPLATVILGKREIGRARRKKRQLLALASCASPIGTGATVKALGGHWYGSRQTTFFVCNWAVCSSDMFASNCSFFFTGWYSFKVMLSLVPD